MTAWGDVSKRRDRPPKPARGPLALVITPDGAAILTALPAREVAAAAALAEIVGGNLTAIGDQRWIAYLDDDGARNDKPVNLAADHLARMLGWRAAPWDVLLGPAVFLGRDGPRETDVPGYVLGMAGVVPPDPDGGES